MTTRDDEDVTGASRRAGITAWRHIADRLAAEIASGAVAPGTRLPTEQALARRFAVNRHTVRRALAELSANGLVRASRGSGTFAEGRPIPHPIAPRTRFSEIVARTGREPGGLLAGADRVPAEAAVAAALQVPVGSAVLRLAVVRSADGAPVSAATSFLPLPRFEDLPALWGDGTLSAALARCGVEDYRRAETRVSARLATLAEAKTLELAPGRVVLVVDGINVDLAGVPIQATTALFAADRVELVIES